MRTVEHMRGGGVKPPHRDLVQNKAVDQAARGGTCLYNAQSFHCIDTLFTDPNTRSSQEPISRLRCSCVRRVVSGGWMRDLWLGGIKACQCWFLLILDIFMFGWLWMVGRVNIGEPIWLHKPCNTSSLHASVKNWISMELIQTELKLHAVFTCSSLFQLPCQG